MKKGENFHKSLEPLMCCRDYTVSNEDYELLTNKKYDMLVTSPVPEDLDSYYKSEDYISHTNSRKTLIDKVYHRVRKYTIEKKVTLINSFNTEGKNLLDVGAGTGDFLVACKNNGWNASGIEPSLDARKIASDKKIELNEDLFLLQEKSYDVITLWHVLEHVINLEDYIVQLKRLLKEDGVLVIAVPNYKSYDAMYYKEYWAAFDVPRHLWHFSQKSISKLFQEVNMKVIQTKPMKFDSYYVSLLSEKYKSGSINPLKAFYVGFRSNLKAKKTTEYSSLIYMLKKE